MTPGERSAVQLLLDEHVWEGLAAALRELGFDAVHVYGTPPALTSRLAAS